MNICVGTEKSRFSVTCLSVFGYLLLGYFVTALVPSLTACFANSPGSKRRIDVWISLDCGHERNSTLSEKHRPFDTQTPVSTTSEGNRTTLQNRPPFPEFCSDGASDSERSLIRRTITKTLIFVPSTQNEWQSCPRIFSLQGASGERELYQIFWYANSRFSNYWARSHYTSEPTSVSEFCSVALQKASEA